MMSHPWRPSASMAALRRRAQLLSQLREFFAAREVLEVSTPVMASSGPRDPHLELVQASFGDLDQRQFYLQPSPESAMKRLLAAGSGAIYQIGPAFRAAESGQRHNPEFTLLEWYRPGFTLEQLMDEVDDLLKHCLGCEPARRSDYSEEFQRHVGLHPLQADLAQLMQIATQAGLNEAQQCSRDQLLDFLFCECVEPNLGPGVVFVANFPPEQAAMAQIEDGVAKRVEVYAEGMELANAYLELLDAQELRERFEAHAVERALYQQVVPPMDEALLAAMTHGLPAMSGIALGLDRLCMLAMNAEHIDEVLSFAIGRA